MSLTITDYRREDVLVTRAARELRDHDVAFVGIGLPIRAANVARHLQAPGAQLVYESGIYGASPDRWPESIGDPCLVVNSLAIHSMADLFLFYLQGGLIDVGFLGAAQVDRFGNINTTVVGEYARPVVRLPGSGGACEIALLSKRLVVTLPQTRRGFPERVDFRTSPGNGTALPFRPLSVISDMAVFEADAATGELVLTALHPGVTLDELRQHVGWEPRVRGALDETPPPTTRELDLLRHYEP